MACTHLLARLSATGCLLCRVRTAEFEPEPGPDDEPAEPTPTDPLGWRSGDLRWDDPDADDDPEDLAEVLRRLDDDACRDSLYEFVRLAFAVTNPGVELEDGPHIEAVCFHIQRQLEDSERCRRDRSATLIAQNLLVNVPPRTLKTTILTCATVWAWLRWPTLRIMYLSANPRVASNSARMARDLMNSHWFRTTFRPSWSADELDEQGRPVPEPDPLFGIRPDQDALSDLGNTAGGQRIARGLASSITGEGCDWLIVDDPHDVKDGSDKVEKACEDYDGAVHGRLNNHRTGIRTLIMQRLRQNDLSGAWLKANVSLLHLRLPMEFEQAPECTCGSCVGANAYGWSDWRRDEGETLHPRFTPAFLIGEQARLLSRYVGQHQQRPGQAGGLIFKVGWWEWHSTRGPEAQARPAGARTSPPIQLGRRRDGSLDLDWLCISVDATGGSTADTASALGHGIIGGKVERRHLLEDRTQGPRTWLQTIEDIKQDVLVAARIAGRQPKITVLVEKKALGQALIDQLAKAVAEGELNYPDGSRIPVVVEAYEPTGKGDKEQRAELMEPDIHAGLLSLEDGADWVPPYRAELEGFPRAPRNDRVDYTSQCLDHFRNYRSGWVAFFKKQNSPPLIAARTLAATGR